MTAALFVEAIDTVRTLGWALAVWIVLTAVAALLAAYTIAAAVTWPCEAAWRALTGALAASRAVRALPEAQTALTAAHARTAPTWARTEHEEAA
jgi:hypothetical protein